MNKKAHAFREAGSILRPLGASLLVLAVVSAPSTSRADDALLVAGFASASYAGNFDERTPQFSLEQAEIDLTRQLSERGAVRVDLEWVWDGTDWAVAAEQGWLSYQPAFAPGLTLTAGRFNAPIGFESLDIPDMFQISHSLVFNYLTPANLSGVMGNGAIGRGFDLKAYAANDWELNSENNGTPTLGGRLGWASPGSISGGVSILSGMRDGAQTVRNTVLDVDITITPMERLLLGGELNTCQASLDGEDATWLGAMVMAHWKATDVLGFTGRFDMIDDSDDLVFGSGLSEQRTSATAAGVVTLGPGMRLLCELRMDASDEDVFADHDGEAKSSTVGGAVNLTYSF